MEEKLYCTRCECLIEDDDYYTIHDEIICDRCRDDYTVTCECCGELIWSDEDCGDDNIYLCESCRDENYCSCYHCDRLIHNNDAYEYDGDYYCYDCYEELDKHKSIHPYSYKPCPKFFGKYDKGDSTRFFGVELEVDKGGYDNDNAREILDYANYDDEHIYIKSDSSLDDGFEIVSHPATLDYHLNEFPWEDITHCAIEQGYRSHQTSTCGLHVHVNRLSLGDTRADQEEVISRILYLVEAYWNELLKFSRRTEYAMNRWASRYGYESTPKKLMDKAKRTYNRYVAVNLCPHDTIEFRLFRGTLKLNTLYATIQLVNHICETALFLCDCEIQSLSWSDFVAAIQEPELIRYLKERRLYINEEITNEEDI